MSNKRKLDLIRSLKPGDIVITGNHIGAIRYLGPLEGLEHKNHNPNDRTRIYNLYAGIELTEPNGHMDGSMHINGKKITYFTTKYGNNLNKKRRKKRPINPSENESKYDTEDIDDLDDAKYGILIPAISIQKKIDSFTLLKKITMVFEQYKIIKKRFNYHKNQHRTDQQSNQNEQSLIDIKTNSDLISVPTNSGYGIRSMPRTQPSIPPNNYSAGFNSNNNNNNDAYKYKKFSTAPVFINGGFSNAYDTLSNDHGHNNNMNSNNNNNENTTRNNDKLSLKTANSAPYHSRMFRSAMDFTNSNSNNNGPINNGAAINNGYLMHRYSHTLNGQSYENHTNQRLFAPQSNVTTPHIDDEINNSSFPSISEEQPTFDKHAKSSPSQYKKPLNSSLPAPHQRHQTNALNRVQSYTAINNNKTIYAKTNPSTSRTRGNSFQSYASHISHTATKRTPEPPNNNNNNNNAITAPNNVNKLSISSSTNNIQTSPISCPVSPAISHQTMVINSEDENNNENNNNNNNKNSSSINSTPNINEHEKPTEITVTIEEIEELPKIPTTILSPEHSQQSDTTMNTQRSRAVSGHHPSASMYTHAPLNHWDDSNGKNKLTSVGGSADKNKDLSSLAIKVSSPRHTRPKSAMNFNQRESLNVNNKIGHVANQDSVHLKQLLADLKKNKLNNINGIVLDNINDIDDENINENDMNIILSSDENTSLDNDSNKNDNDHPKLMDNETTAATVHSPTADVLENLVTNVSVGSSPEEKLAEVENNEDEKQLLPTDAMSDIATPIPKEAFDVKCLDEFDVFDVENNNKPKRLSLTESSLRKHNKVNKRRGSIDNTSSSNNEQIESHQIIEKSKNITKNYKFNPTKMDIHHHVQTLSEPMLPKFALMVNYDSSEDEKSASSDGEDTHSLGMENNLEDSIHTHDVTEDDVEYMQHNIIVSATPPARVVINNNNNKLFSPTFTADSISRRSSINLTSGVWDYITPKGHPESDINDVSNITLYNLSNYGDGYQTPNTNSSSIGYQTPKQQYIRRTNQIGSTTPTYSSYKTRHEYLRDMTYFTTLHRAQQFKKFGQNNNNQNNKDTKIVEPIIEDENVNEEKQHSKSTSLHIIQEKIFDDENNNNNQNNKDNEKKKEEEEIVSGHRPQLSCDTRAAIEGGIEPYKPTHNTLHQSAMV